MNETLLLLKIIFPFLKELFLGGKYGRDARPTRKKYRIVLSIAIIAIVVNLFLAHAVLNAINKDHKQTIVRKKEDDESDHSNATDSSDAINDVTHYSDVLSYLNRLEKAERNY